MSVVKEEVTSLHLRSRCAEEAEIESAGLCNAERLGENKLRWRGIAAGKKDRHSVNQKRARQTIHDRGQHFIQIGLSIQITSEFDEGSAKVIARPVEEAIDAVLNPLANR